MHEFHARHKLLLKPIYEPVDIILFEKWFPYTTIKLPYWIPITRLNNPLDDLVHGIVLPLELTFVSTVRYLRALTVGGMIASLSIIPSGVVSLVIFVNTQDRKTALTTPDLLTTE